MFIYLFCQQVTQLYIKELDKHYILQILIRAMVLLSSLLNLFYTLPNFMTFRVGIIIFSF